MFYLRSIKHHNQRTESTETRMYIIIVSIVKKVAYIIEN